MNKQAKRLASLALALILLLALLPGSVFAADVIASGTCGADGDNLTWTLDSDGVLTISGNGDMQNYNGTPPWNTAAVRRVVLEPGVTSIGNYAFYMCFSMTSVTIPEGVTRIGQMAFFYCMSLTQVSIPSTVTDIEYGAFWYCSALTSVEFTEGLSSIGYSAFGDCSALTGVTIPASVTSIDSSSFNGCTNLAAFNVAPGSESFCSDNLPAAHPFYTGLFPVPGGEGRKAE